MLGFLQRLHFYWRVRALISLLFIKLSFQNEKESQIEAKQGHKGKGGVFSLHIYRQRIKEKQKLKMEEKKQQIDLSHSLVCVPLPDLPKNKNLAQNLHFLNLRTSLPNFPLLNVFSSFQLQKPPHSSPILRNNQCFQLDVFCFPVSQRMLQTALWWHTAVDISCVPVQCGRFLSSTRFDWVFPQV